MTRRLDGHVCSSRSCSPILSLRHSLMFHEQASIFGLDTAAGLCMLIATVVVSGSWLLAVRIGRVCSDGGGGYSRCGGTTRTHIAGSELAPLGVAALAASAVSTSRAEVASDVTSPNLHGCADRWLVGDVCPGSVVSSGHCWRRLPGPRASRQELARALCIPVLSTGDCRSRFGPRSWRGLGLSFAGSCNSPGSSSGSEAPPPLLRRFEAALRLDARGLSHTFDRACVSVQHRYNDATVLNDTQPTL